ncbi:hypothetical protein BDK51DRAFT_37893 [Blyttiomyces helicus]|uniref:F-box domain-containing protein n=1 Tax=Blyttiomyces helicus TaxID=388810 RepID=A0A4P9W310_9FUNG|nr:hypothetical protein BDK51DRAFT_37893 [Blyttiomyces helicus]|eukprot:RKO85000.1 hypothetical protein BDK51DRAFT_37893 [Blyttiomyces helicus]
MATLNSKVEGGFLSRGNERLRDPFPALGPPGDDIELPRSTFSCLPSSHACNAFSSPFLEGLILGGGGARGAGVRSAGLVCRHWEPVASERIWTHVVIRSSCALRKFTRYSVIRPSPTRAERPALVRILELKIEDWQPVHVQFARFVPRLVGLRALIVAPTRPTLTFNPNSEGLTESNEPLRVTTDVIVQFLVSCPNLVVLVTEAPAVTPKISDVGAEGRGDEDGFNRDAVRSGIGRLKCLRLSEDSDEYFGSPADGSFYKLLIQSDEAPPLELNVTGRSDCGIGSLSLGPPLPNLEVFKSWEGDIDFVIALLLGPPSQPSRLLRACPSIDQLQLYDYDFDCILATLQDHPLLTVLSLQTNSDMRVPSEPLQRFLHSHGQNLKILDISYEFSTTDSLLACIADTAPRLERLCLTEHPGMSFTRTKSIKLSDMAFIANLKIGCPNLRQVYHSSSGGRLTDLGCLNDIL